MTMIDPTKNGLPLRTIEGDAADVFAYALMRWQEENPAISPETPMGKMAEQFTAFARQLYLANKPVAMDTLGRTFSLRFQEGQVLPFVSDGDNQSHHQGYDAGVHLTQPDMSRGKGSLSSTPSFGITGNEQRR